jgi:hypothetical protein
MVLDLPIDLLQVQEFENSDASCRVPSSTCQQHQAKKYLPFIEEIKSVA